MQKSNYLLSYLANNICIEYIINPDTSSFIIGSLVVIFSIEVSFSQQGSKDLVEPHPINKVLISNTEIIFFFMINLFYNV